MKKNISAGTTEKKNTTKKNTTIIVIIILAVIVGMVCLYAYLSTKQRNAMADAALSKVQIALSRDLEKDYPPTVKQVLSYFAELQQCLYNEECTIEEIEQIGMQERLLFDKELLENNDETTYLVRLKEEVEAFQKAGHRIYRISIASSNNVDTFKQDGFEFARINCTYYLTEDGHTFIQDMVYLMRRDENRQWKIYGWDRKVDENASTGTQGDVQGENK